MRIAVPRESAEGETRVALVPDTVGRLTRRGNQITVQAGAGAAAGFLDDAYRDAGADVDDDIATALSKASVVPVVQAPSDELLARLGSGTVLIGLLRAATNPELLARLAAQGLTVFSMELVPRIARAQRLDALSSQSSLAGYKAVLIAANAIGRFFPLMMTAAGTIPPARVLVLGAGVAGLQAIATARRLGAVVEAFDVRAATREQVESLGAKFIEVEQPSDVETAGGYARELAENEQERERQTIREHARESDAVITTALIPGRPAPLLITADAVAEMRPGSVIVDLAAETGGNCELSQPGETVVRKGVTIHAPLNVPGMMPYHASEMYSRNVAGLLDLIVDKEGALSLDFSDEVVRRSCAAHGGKVVLGEQESLAPATA